MLRGIASSVMLGLIAFGSIPARAQSPAGDKERAAQLAREGEEFGDKSLFREALGKFKQAARLDPSTPAYLCNVGLAYYGLNDFARAHLNLLRCYDAATQWPPNLKEVFDYVEASLAKRDYAAVTLTGVPEDARISIKEYEDEGELHAPLKVYLPAGNYIYEASATGYKTHFGEIRVIDPRKPLKEQYRLEPAQSTIGATRDVPNSEVTPIGGREDGDAAIVGTSNNASSSRRQLAWVSIGGGTALALGGMLAYLSAKDKVDALSADLAVLSSNEYDQRVDAIRLREALAYTGWGVGAAAIGVGVYLLVKDSERTDKPLVSAAPISGGGIVFMSWER